MCKICAGIVTYNPSIERLLDNVNAIRHQVEKVIIVDNGSETICEIEKRLSEYGEVIIIKNDNNLGIATALNQMCDYADKAVFDWILTLDQDTVCPENIIEFMLPYADKANIGIVCPDVNYEGWTNSKKSNKSTEYVYACMTSASLTNLTAWKEVNGFNDDYFIDFVDNEFCMRLSLKGYKVLRVFACRINHQLGESSEIKVLGLFKIRYTRHSPIRFYYMSRNHYVFIKTYRKNLPVLKEYCKLTYDLVNGWMFSKNKSEIIKYIRKGLSDGRHNRLGKI